MFELNDDEVRELYNYLSRQFISREQGTYNGDIVHKVVMRLRVAIGEQENERSNR